MPMFVRGNILKPFSSSARPEKCHGISNRQQVMRQQNRISSILPNTVTRLCGDLDEIFWRPKILMLNVCWPFGIQRKFFQLLEILNKTEACVVFSCFTFLILSLPCQLPFHALLIALFCSVFFPSSKIGFSHLIFRIGSKIRHPWKRQERSRSSSNLQTSSLQLKAKMFSASLRSRETQSQQSHGLR